MTYPTPLPQPHLWLVGAGPGDPELMTLKGARVLSKAQLVLYDSLVHKDVLDLAHPEAQLICVGKRAPRKNSSTIGSTEVPSKAFALFDLREATPWCLVVPVKNLPTLTTSA